MTRTKPEQADARAARLKAALRDNLRRRKAQARLRAAQAGQEESAVPGEPGTVPDPRGKED